MKYGKRLLAIVIAVLLFLSIGGCKKQDQAAGNLTQKETGLPFRAEALSISLPAGAQLPEADFWIWDNQLAFHSYKDGWLYTYDLDSCTLDHYLQVESNCHQFARDDQGRIWTLYFDSLSDDRYSTLKCFQDGVEVGSYACRDFKEESIECATFLYFGNSYLYLYGYGERLAALDISGDVPTLAFTMEAKDPLIEGSLTRVLCTGAGTLLLARAEPEGVYYEILACDLATKSWQTVDRLEIAKDDTFFISTAAGDCFCLDTGKELYLYDLEAGTRTLCFNWELNGIPRGINPYGFDTQNFLMFYGGKPYRVIPRSGENDHAAVQVLTLAALNPDPMLRSFITDFNMQDGNVKIELLDYSQYNTDESNQGGLLRLSTDLIAGNTPDLFDLYSLPGERYGAKGLLEDLYPYLEQDPELDRENFFPNILAMLETDGKLYEIIPGFGVMTFVGRESQLGGRTSWDFEEFYAVTEALPEDVAVLDAWITRNLFLEYVLTFNGELYVDWGSGTCSFDSPDFIRLLEFCKSRTPETSDMLHYADESPMLEERQLLTLRYPSNIEFIDYLSTITSGEPNFIGFPSASGNGNAAVPYLKLGICSQSENKAACWSFLRTLLLPQAQADMGCFPLDKTVFAQQKENYIASAVDMAPDEVEKNVQLMENLINSIDHSSYWDNTVYNIVLEAAAPFFAGDKSAEEAAAIIQSRVSTYVAEQK